MEVIGHQTIEEQADRRSLPGFVKEFQEGDAIAHRATSVATVQDVVAITALRGSTGARLGDMVKKDRRATSGKIECPLFSPR